MTLTTRRCQSLSLAWLVIMALRSTIETPSPAFASSRIKHPFTQSPTVKSLNCHVVTCILTNLDASTLQMCTPCNTKTFGNVHLYKAKIKKSLTIESRYCALRQKRAMIIRMMYEFAHENKSLKADAAEWCGIYRRKLSRQMPYRSALSQDDMRFRKYRELARLGVTKIEVPDV